MAVRRVNHVGLNLEIHGNEISWVCVIGVDSTDFGRGEDHESRLLGGEEELDVVLASEIELGVGSEDQIGVAQSLKLPNNGGTHQAAVSGHEDLRRFVGEERVICSELKKWGYEIRVFEI